jgi:hypothetical protein
MGFLTEINTNPKEHIMTHLTNKLIQTALLTFGLFLLSACGNYTGDGIGEIDLSEYMPSENMDKVYRIVKGDDTSDINTTILHRVSRNTIDGHAEIQTKEDGWIIKKSTINDINISTWDYTKTIPQVGVRTITDRYVDIGDRIFESCFADALIDTMTKEGYDRYTYDGDILKIKCGYGNHISYSYLMRGIGVIAEISDDCMSADGARVESSETDTCPAERRRHTYKFLNLDI